MVSAWRGPGTLVLVTHALTVRALLGFLPIQDETVVLKPGSASAGGDLVGLIAAPQWRRITSETDNLVLERSRLAGRSTRR